MKRMNNVFRIFTISLVDFWECMYTLHTYMCVYVRACVWREREKKSEQEREREREREREKEREREREREGEREKERDREREGEDHPSA